MSKLRCTYVNDEYSLFFKVGNDYGYDENLVDDNYGERCWEMDSNTFTVHDSHGDVIVIFKKICRLKVSKDGINWSYP